MPLCVQECTLKMAQGEAAFRRLAPLLAALVNTAGTSLVHVPHASDSTVSHPSDGDEDQ